MSEPAIETPEPTTEPEPDLNPANPDEEPTPEPEPIEGEPAPPEPAPEPAGLSDKEREKQQKALDAETKRHTEKIALLLGDDATEAIVCPFCDPQLQGFLYPASLDQPRDEIQARMIDVLRQPEQVNYETANDVETCERCKGYGKTKTGSKVPGNETKVCANCKGYGFYPPPGLGQNGRIEPEQERELALVGAPPPVTDDQDAWGSPRLLADGQENPNYGRMPQYKNPDLP